MAEISFEKVTRLLVKLHDLLHEYSKKMAHKPKMRRIKWLENLKFGSFRGSN